MKEPTAAAAKGSLAAMAAPEANGASPCGSAESNALPSSSTENAKNGISQAEQLKDEANQTFKGKGLGCHAHADMGWLSMQLECLSLTFFNMRSSFLRLCHQRFLLWL